MMMAKLLLGLFLSAVPLSFAGNSDCTAPHSLLQRSHSSTESQLQASEESGGTANAAYLNRALNLVLGLARNVTSNATAWSTGLTETERGSLSVIQDFIDQMFSSANESHNSNQQTVNEIEALIEQCSTDVTERMISVSLYKIAMEGARIAHSTCRVDEAAAFDRTNIAEHNWNGLRRNSDNTPSSCAAVTYNAQTLGTNVATLKANMEKCLRDLQPFHESHIQWHDNYTYLERIAALCDTNQTAFEREFCAWTEKYDDTCDDYSRCRRNGIALRNATHADVEISAEARRADYVTGKHIKCLFQVFEAGNENKSGLLDECAALTVDTSHLVITYPPIPNPRDICPLSTHRPCDIAWETAEYRNKAWSDKVTMVDCTACGDHTPPPTPAPPAMEVNPEESARTYSSVWGGDPPGTGHAVSMLDSGQAWSAVNSQLGEWMQIDLRSDFWVAGVITQGRGHSSQDQYVTSYRVEYSRDGASFSSVAGEFAGNDGVREDDRVQSTFPAAVQARYIRIYPTAWNNHMSMRAGVLVQDR